MTGRTGHEPGESASERVVIPLAPGQRAMFQDRRIRRCLPVYGIPGVSSSTVAAIERGTGRHHIATLASFAEALGLDRAPSATPGCLPRA